MKTLRPRKTWEFNMNEITIWDDFFTTECLKILKYRILYGKYCDTDRKYYQAIDYFKNTDYVSERIAEDLRKKIDIPEFQRAWSFVYHTKSKGVSIHCDASLLNLNIWVSSDKSVKDKSYNGLNIYKIKPPKDWPREKWNGDAGPALEYIKSKNIEPVKIPYKSNRAILFDGAYFHQTNGVSMKEGIENRRVSYTMLFGSQLE